MEQRKQIDAYLESDDEDLSRDWLKIDKSVKNDGFRIGMECSQEQSLQTGFNAGFKEAMQMALAGGKLQGSISAKLSYAAGDISKVISSLCPVEAASHNLNIESGATFASNPLQSLLSSNSDLIFSIPSLLQTSLIKNVHLPSKEKDMQADCTNSNSKLCCLKKNPELEYLEIFPPTTESLECTAVDTFQGNNDQNISQNDKQKQTLSCEHVCNSKSHFWNQLENFKMQARSLEVLSAHD